jgi:hypothetical protein
MKFYFADIEMLMSGWNTLYKGARQIPDFPEPLDRQVLLFK